MTEEQAWELAQERAPDITTLFGEGYEELGGDWLVHVVNLHGGGLGVSLYKIQLVHTTIQSQEAQ